MPLMSRQIYEIWGHSHEDHESKFTLYQNTIRLYTDFIWNISLVKGQFEPVIKHGPLDAKTELIVQT